MSEAIQLDDYIDETRSDSYPSRAVARKSGGSGGDMDEVLKPLSAVESSVSELRVQVGGIAATIPYLATKDDLNELRVQVGAIAAKVPHLATSDGLNELKAVIPHLATRDSLNELKAVIPYLATNDGLAEVRAVIPHLATSADLKAGIGSLRAEISAMETRIIKWMIATVLTAVGLATGAAFSLAKFVH